jgi:hypothetical protein
MNIIERLLAKRVLYKDIKPGDIITAKYKLSSDYEDIVVGKKYKVISLEKCRDSYANSCVNCVTGGFSIRVETEKNYGIDWSATCDCAFTNKAGLEYKKEEK